ncbi:nose resistant to fluoxetine protein 6 [Anoplophora glabripennis]|uniref:nose resistant to fluoxetine protein 6 n=1 Tax=Anoplophora glabripennis TaxID=217634 RepID=UPI000874C783|nr:nose resistant to fluoxetine protein 6 [Anoplophora glabripennis]
MKKWILVVIGLGVASCTVDHVRVSQNEFDIPDLGEICSNLNLEGVSEKCAEQLDVVCANVTLLTTILDASSKFPYPGLGFASKLNYGNFDQCLTVDHTYEGGRILGKYCTVGLVIPDVNDNISDPTTFYRLSMCRPDACNASDFNAMAQNMIEGFPELFQDIMCQTTETNSTLSPGSIAVVAIFGFFIWLMVISTTYDIYIHQSHLEHHHPLLVSFSVLSNGRKLLHISRHSNNKEHIEPFNGLRVISMMWIVAGHGFVGWQGVSVTDRNRVNNWLDNFYAVYISPSHLAVDTFFFMSGFLLAFQYLKRKGKPLVNQILSVPQMYLHRYLRLTPAMLMLYLVAITFFKNMGDGPLWLSTNELVATCRKYWWPFFLYIQNYYNYDDLCLTQTWYLSVDMQMFILSPILMIPLAVILRDSFKFLMSMFLLLALNIFFTFMPMVIKLIFPEYDNEYDTHSRLINYGVGIMLGTFMREKIDKPFLYVIKEKAKHLTNLAIWAVIILGLLASLISYQLVEMGKDTTTINVFQSLVRPAWCIGLSWVTYSCYHGYGGFVNWILCRPIYQVLGRLTYSIYLVHGLVIAYYVLVTKVSWHFTDYNAFYIFCGHYVMSILVAVFWTLAFESPLIIIEKFLMGGGRKPRTVKQDVPQSESAPPIQNVQQEFRKSSEHNGTKEDPPGNVEGGEMYKRNNHVY